MKRRWLILFCCSMLVSCATGRRDQSNRDWPEALPRLEYFQCSYEASPSNQQYQTEAEYLDWILNFYQGSLLYPTGWLDVEAVILGALSPQDLKEQDRQSQQILLGDLGARIAAEWARHNDVRLIDNRLLSQWGSMLQLAPNETELRRYVEAISGDIQLILARELDPADVNPRWYEERLQIQLFDDF